MVTQISEKMNDHSLDIKRFPWFFKLETGQSEQILS